MIARVFKQFGFRCAQMERRRVYDYVDNLAHVHGACGICEMSKAVALGYKIRVAEEYEVRSAERRTDIAGL